MEITKLSDLPNIGKEVERQLQEVGITTYEQLKELGAIQAWQKIKEMDSSACIHRLLALEGAIQGIKKSELSEDRKAELREFYKWQKQDQK
ncbi:TfoX/Sxy family protein [Anaerosporobacter faecicola]|uniref:TfoX/Sxy family protein n=1 Tax=Anaerosporobacter faecicola TaxID=2718714 RepID=UPI002ED12E9C